MAKPLLDLLIKPREQEHPALLDTTTVIAHVEEHVKPWLSLIRDLVSYGTNLIIRSVVSSARTTKDRVVLTILLRQAVAMLDSIEVLLSRGCLHTANLQLRALFESSTYIEWILASDAERKARHYHVHNLRRKRIWASRAISGSPEAAAFSTAMGKYGLSITEDIKKKSRRQIRAINKILAHPDLAAINVEFDAIKAKRKQEHDVAWYYPLGQKSFGSIARATGNSALYVMVYSGASEVMHSSSDDQHIKVEDGKLSLKQIRSLEGFDPIFRFTVCITLNLYQKILSEYRPDELSRFSHKYVEQWRNQFLQSIKINYEISEV